eukprot:gene9504-12804_t
MQHLEQQLTNHRNWSILNRLIKYNLDECLNEVVVSIWGEEFVHIKKLGGIFKWNNNDVCNWISKLPLLKSDKEIILKKLSTEWVDGATVMVMTCYEWVSIIGLDYCDYLIIDTIIAGWRLGTNFVIPRSLTIPAGILLKSMINLTGLPREMAHSLVIADENCTKNGIGYCYGQLVCLGYKEYRILNDQKWQSYGYANEMFQLNRRKLPNGYSIPNLSHQQEVNNDFESGIIFSFPEINDRPTRNTKVGFEFDPTKDSFNLGRSTSSSIDLDIPGVIHVDESGLIGGPVSRFACRIECSRLAPFKSYIYAGCLDENKEIFVNKIIKGHRQSVTVLDSNNKKTFVDGFTTFGVKLWQPEIQEWLEISVLGDTYIPRKGCREMPGPHKETNLKNELTDGSIIDIAGILLLFQNPFTMTHQKKIDPIPIIEKFNNLHPHCPVLFNPIKLSYIDSELIMKKQINKLYESHKNVVSTIHRLRRNSNIDNVHVPITSYEEDLIDQWAYIFPACGHVHGFHKSLENGTNCPLCRTPGCFVPIAFAFESAICNDIPTHVFNPCRHAASKSTC